MNGSNNKTREAFLAEFTHPRKLELATMILDGKNFDELKEAGYGRINVLEMVREINRNVEGQEDFELEVPEADLSEEEAAALDEKKKWIGGFNHVPQCKSGGICAINIERAERHSRQ